MAIDFLTEQDAFSEEEDASFGSGQQDMLGQWLSMTPTKRGGAVSGLVFKVGNDYFDGAVEALNSDRASQGKPQIQRVTVVHNLQKDQKPGDNIKEYWLFEEFSLFVIAKGLKEPMADQGIVYCWTLDKEKKFRIDTNGKPRPNVSHLLFRAYLHELTGPGYYLAPVQITSKVSRSIEYGKVLRDQQRVIQAYRNLKKDPKAVVPFWAFSIPMRVGELKPYGHETSSNMCLVESAIPAEITREYLQEHYVGSVMVEELRSMIRTELENTLVWAKETTQRLLQGKEEKQQGQNTFSQSDKDIDEYMNESWEESRIAYDEPVRVNLATENQRKALRNIARQKPQFSHYANMADDDALTFDQASKAIGATSSGVASSKK